MAEISTDFTLDLSVCSCGSSGVAFKVLIADASPSERSLIQALVSQTGFETLLASDGCEALELYRQHLPDLVLLDLVMPVMDGFDVLEAIRAEQTHRWVPVVFLAELNDQETFKKALLAGADDFLPKPIRPGILNAKIMALGRVLCLQTRVLSQQVELQAYRDAAEEEKRTARSLMEQLSNKNRIDDQAVRVLSKPAEHLNGDVVAALRTPSGKLHVMLADGTGHGLTAALNVLPIVEPFYSMTAKGFTLSAILDELNRKLYNNLPRDCYVAACMLAVDTETKRVEIWNAGLPDVLLIDRANHSVRRATSNHLPLGILRPADFDPVPAGHDFSQASLMVLASDGLVEALADDDLELGSQRLAELMMQMAQDDELPEEIVTLSQSLDHPDDITLVAIECGSLLDEREKQIPVRKDKLKPVDGRPGRSWSFELAAEAALLPQMDVVPMVLNLARGYGLDQGAESDLFVILSELCNNALDHGLLCLDSEYKNRSTDMERYFDMRDERLKRLEAGMLEIRLERMLDEVGAVLEITVRDTGLGFDVSSLNSANDFSRCGRGIMLVRSLCESLEYRGHGNVAVARLRLGYMACFVSPIL